MACRRSAVRSRLAPPIREPTRLVGQWIKFQVSPSSRGLGHHPFTVDTGVRIPVGTPLFKQTGSSQGLPVLPVNMRARNSGLFYWFAKWSTELRDMTVFYELLNKKGDLFDFTIGQMIAPEALEGDAAEVTRALEQHTVFDLAADPGETTNLFESRRDIGNRLQRSLRALEAQFERAAAPAKAEAMAGTSPAPASRSIRHSARRGSTRVSGPGQNAAAKARARSSAITSATPFTPNPPVASSSTVPSAMWKDWKRSKDSMPG